MKVFFHLNDSVYTKGLHSVPIEKPSKGYWTAHHVIKDGLQDWVAFMSQPYLVENEIEVEIDLSLRLT